jgi:hypothetical protein
MSKRDSASRRGSVELESGLSSSRLSPVSETEDFINLDRDKRLDELSRPMLPPSRASQRGGDVGVETSSPPRRKPIPAIVIIRTYIIAPARDPNCAANLQPSGYETLTAPVFVAQADMLTDHSERMCDPAQQVHLLDTQISLCECLTGSPFCQDND